MLTGTIVGDRYFILVDVDDLLVAAKSTEGLAGGQAAVLNALRAWDRVAPTFFLGLHVDRCGETGAISLGQRQHAATLVDRFGLSQDNPARLPMGVGFRLSNEGKPLQADLKMTRKELVGILLHRANAKHPDLTFTVGLLARYAAAPMGEYLASAKSILRNVKGKMHIALT